MKIEYYGTKLNEKGHFLRDLLSESLDWESRLNTSKFPFDIYSFTKGKEKGFVSKQIIENYKIIAIEGSCCDHRWGTVSVFITTENVTLKEFEDYLLNHKWVKEMIELMSFEVKI